MFTNVDRIQLASGINGMLGTWLVISPWALAFVQDQTATGNSVLAGVMVATFGLVRAYGAYRSSWLSWANTVIGGWVVVAPWLLDYGQGAVRTNNVLVGVAVMLLAAWSAMAQPAPLRN